MFLCFILFSCHINLIFSAYSLHFYYPLTFFHSQISLLCLIFSTLNFLSFHFQVLSFTLSHVYFCFLKACFSFFFLQYLRLYCILLFSIFSFPVLCSFTFIFSLVLHIFSAILFSITFASHTCSQFVFSISPSHFKKSLLCLTE